MRTTENRKDGYLWSDCDKAVYCIAIPMAVFESVTKQSYRLQITQKYRNNNINNKKYAYTIDT